MREKPIGQLTIILLINRQALLNANLGCHKSEKTKQQLSKVHKQKWKDPKFRKEHISNIMNVAGINKIPVYQYDLDENFVKQWDSIYDVQLILYGSKKNGNLKRNIINK